MVIMGRDPTRYSPIPIIAVCSSGRCISGIKVHTRGSDPFHHIFHQFDYTGKGARFRHHDDVAVNLVLLADKFGGEEQDLINFLPHLAMSEDIAAWAMSTVSAGGEGSITKPSSSAVASR